MLLLPEDRVLSHSWMIRDMLCSDIPCDRVNDAIYLDVDPDAFHMIYDILQGFVDVANLKMSDIYWNRLRITADFLLCPEISKLCENHLSEQTSMVATLLEQICSLQLQSNQLQVCEHQLSEQTSTVAMLREQVCSLQCESNLLKACKIQLSEETSKAATLQTLVLSLQTENKLFKDTLENIADGDFYYTQCSAHRLRRPGNVCMAVSHTIKLGEICACDTDHKILERVRIRSVADLCDTF